MIGKTLLHYRIDEKIGAGGMGVVYLAHDGKLARSVALKFLPDELAADPDRRGRFEREARLLASLNHANVGGIFGFESAEGAHFLVLEYVPGKTLAERIRERSLPLDEALRIALQVADGCAVAHERSIIHRDLKPENIKVTDEGHVSVLDFGLAKALDDGGSGADSSSGDVHTAAGMILGTTAYMSPEQARGSTLDRRTDLWSFGCVFFEMIAGSRAFPGKTAPDTIAAILEGVPDWDALPEGTPPRVRKLLTRCLTKKTRRRMQDFGEVRIELEDAIAELDAASSSRAGAGSAGAAGGSRLADRGARALDRRASLVVTASLATAGIALVALVWMLVRSGPGPVEVPDLRVERLSLELPRNEWFESSMSFALSPAGDAVAYFSEHADGSEILNVRRLDQWEPRSFGKMHYYDGPVFSPDGGRLAYVAEDALYVCRLDGDAPPEKIASVPGVIGIDWGDDGSIFYGPVTGDGVRRIPPGGGEAQSITTLLVNEGEFGHWSPLLLPDRDTVLFTVWKSGLDDVSVASMSLASRERRTLLEGAYDARYSASGHLLFGARGGLYAIAFDLATGRTSGDRVCVLPDVRTSPFECRVSIALGPDGTLYYQRQEEVGSWLVSLDRAGRETRLRDEKFGFSDPSYSPDGTAIAVTRSDPDEIDIWRLEVERGAWARLTRNGLYSSPCWSPDGTMVVANTVSTGASSIARFPADGSRPPEIWIHSEWDLTMHDWGRAGLVFNEWHPQRRADLYLQHVDEHGKLDSERRPLVVTDAYEGNAQLSPDERFLAYSSDESGTMEIYVRPFPEGDARWKISSDGGHEVRWNPRPGKREIFYRKGQRVYSVPFTVDPEFRPEAETFLFEGPYFDLRPHPTEDTFVACKYDESDLRSLAVVRNFTKELAQRVPTGKAAR